LRGYRETLTRIIPRTMKLRATDYVGWSKPRLIVDTTELDMLIGVWINDIPGCKCNGTYDLG